MKRPQQRKLLFKSIFVIRGIEIQTAFANISKYFVAVVIENIAKTEEEEGDIFVKMATVLNG